LFLSFCYDNLKPKFNLGSFENRGPGILAVNKDVCVVHIIEWLRERTKHRDIFFFPPITQSCSISDVLFAGGRGVSDFSVLKYY